jgi:hypothetical protein
MTTIHVTYRTYSWDETPVPSYWDSWDDVRADQFPNHVYAGAIEVDIPPPPNVQDLNRAEITGLRKEQGKYQTKINAIEEQIGKLLCIEYGEGCD